MRTVRVLPAKAAETPEDLSILNELFASAARLCPGKVLGVVLVCDMDDVVPGVKKATFVNVVGRGPDRDRVLRAIADLGGSLRGQAPAPPPGAA